MDGTTVTWEYRNNLDLWFKRHRRWMYQCTKQQKGGGLPSSVWIGFNSELPYLHRFLFAWSLNSHVNFQYVQNVKYQVWCILSSILVHRPLSPGSLIRVTFIPYFLQLRSSNPIPWFNILTLQKPFFVKIYYWSSP